MPELILENEKAPVLRCPLIGQVVSVGRSAANDISIPDDKLAPLFCSFQPTKRGYRLSIVAGRA